ncbi:MAG: DUF401 family protein [bacterium]
MTALGLTLLSFGIILFLARLKVPLWLSILLGAISLGISFGEGVNGLTHAVVMGIVQSTSIGLLLTVTLLLTLSEAMRQTGRMERLVTLIQSFVRRPAFTLAALPALIGLLPMPGGAVFSAPMVRQAAQGSELDGNMLSAINYWWRHIWEHWWPLYPGVILAMSLTNSDLLTFAFFQIPLGIFMVVGGVLLFRATPPELFRQSPAPPPAIKRQILIALAPIGLVLMMWAVGGVLIKYLMPHLVNGGLSQGGLSFLEKFAPLILGLVGSVVYTVWDKPFPFKRLGRLVLSRESVPLLGLVLSVMVYQSMLKEVNAAGAISRELGVLHVPVTLVVILLPFIAGLLTGVAFGFVGVSFPLVLSLVESLPDHPAMRPYVVLAYACGHLGMMLSPLHLCYVVSNRYFNATFGATLRILAWPLILVTGSAAAYFLLLKWAL